MPLQRSEAPVVARDRRDVAAPPARASTGGTPLAGVAAVGLTGIVLAHAGIGPLDGGGLGIDVLLVLAGFVVTLALLAEIEATGRVSLGAFYGRALRVLGPAPAVTLVVVCGVSLVAGGAGELKGEALAALGFASNWYSVGTAGAAVTLGEASVLQHLWAVAIVGQVVLVWPVVVIGCARLGGWARVRRVALVGAVASALLMAVLAVTGDVPGSAAAARVAFGTDTRLTAVLLGAALATAWTPSGPRSPIDPGARRVWNAVGVLALGGIVVAYVAVGETSDAAFRGGSALVAVAAVALVAAATVPFGRLRTVFTAPVFGWVGARAYAIYLWHWPVLAVTEPGGRLPLGGAVGTLVRIVVVVVLADLTHRFLERPLRDGAVGATIERLRLAEGEARARLRRRVAMTTAVAVTVMTVVVAGMAMTPSVASGSDEADVETGSEAVEPQPAPVDCAVRACVALTFDDGPGTHTDRLLRILDEKDVTATFFMLGVQVDSLPGVVRRVHEHGHEIGVHTWDHADLLTIDLDAAEEQIRSGVEAVEAVIDERPRLLRPPYGSTDGTIHELAAQQGLTEILWDVDPFDWRDRDTATVTNRILDGVTRGSIVLMHDTRLTTVDAVPAIIDGLRAAGFTLVPVGTLFDGLLEPGATFSSGGHAPEPTPTVTATSAATP